jgi:hypothetical protein
VDESNPPDTVAPTGTSENQLLVDRAVEIGTKRGTRDAEGDASMSRIRS